MLDTLVKIAREQEQNFGNSLSRSRARVPVWAAWYNSYCAESTIEKPTILCENEPMTTYALKYGKKCI